MKLRLAESALDDIAAILYVSEEHFGAAAAGRYRELVRQALDDISERPTGPLSVARPELGDGIRLWHLRNSRDHVVGSKVREPRHFLVYRVDGQCVVVGRVLFDRMDIGRQVDPETFDQSF